MELWWVPHPSFVFLRLVPKAKYYAACREDLNHTCLCWDLVTEEYILWNISSDFKNVLCMQLVKKYKVRRRDLVIFAKSGLNTYNYSLEKDTGGAKVLDVSSYCLIRINVQKKSVSIF